MAAFSAHVSERFGIDADDYETLWRWSIEHREAFWAEAHKLLPELAPGDLTPDLSGIRPKLYREGEPFRDFVIREEGDRGLPGFIDLIGIESPGLTSCLAIAERVEDLVSGQGEAA